MHPASTHLIFKSENTRKYLSASNINHDQFFVEIPNVGKYSYFFCLMGSKHLSSQRGFCEVQ